MAMPCARGITNTFEPASADSMRPMHITCTEAAHWPLSGASVVGIVLVAGAHGTPGGGLVVAVAQGFGNRAAKTVCLSTAAECGTLVLLMKPTMTMAIIAVMEIPVR
jgi:hypothetical protein